jgi:general secretion pathway protein A
MYLEFFGFTEEPFNITPNSRFLYLSQRHREALAALLYGIEHRKGFIALTGHIGCGKTTICRAMLGRLDREKVRLALILNPELNDLELLQTINSEYGIEAASSSKRELLSALNAFLLEEYRNDRNVVLLIDEAQRLSPQALEQVRLISNLETESAKLIQIALVGQPELADILDLPELEQLNQRITVRFHIEPLSFDELSDYVDHRLKVAEAKKPVRFHKKALRKIYDYSAGVPRRINVLCDRTLLVAFVREQTEVSEEIVVKAIEELGGMPRRRKGSKAEPSSGAVEKPENVASGAPPSAAIGGAPAQPAPANSAVPQVLLAGALLAGLLAIAYAISRPGATNTTAAPPGDTRTAVAGSSASAAAETPATPRATAAPPVAVKQTASPSPTPSTPAPAAITTPSEATSATPSPVPSPTAIPPSSTASAPPPTVTAALMSTTTSLALLSTPAPSPIPPPTPQSSPSPTPVPAWSYDEHGIVRVADPGVSYHAAMLTWLANRLNERLPEDQLVMLRTLSAAQLSELKLTAGRPPLFLREARLAPVLAALNPRHLPVLVQAGDGAPGFGPWSLLLEINGDQTILLDPIAGRTTVAREVLSDHLTAVQALFADREGISGLRPLEEGVRVEALQRRLRKVGLYNTEPSLVFDKLTEAALLAFRERVNLPGPAEVDDALAMQLILDSEVVP